MVPLNLGYEPPESREAREKILACSFHGVHSCSPFSTNSDSPSWIDVRGIRTYESIQSEGKPQAEFHNREKRHLHSNPHKLYWMRLGMFRHPPQMGYGPTVDHATLYQSRLATTCG